MPQRGVGAEKIRGNSLVGAARLICAQIAEDLRPANAHEMRPLVLALALRLLSVGAAPRRVAVIGSGVGGASTAHFLAELLGDDAVTIDVYEAARVGGRAYTLDAAVVGARVDAGATSIFSGNRYLANFITRFGLARADPEPNATVGIWDGAAFRVRWPEDSTIPVRMLARYGSGVLKAVGVVRAAVAKLNKIYDLQAANRTFASPEALLDALGLLPLTQVPRLTQT